METYGIAMIVSRRLSITIEALVQTALCGITSDAATASYWTVWLLVKSKFDLWMT
jgi:hypothetical protein